jgi:hypothetical protein
MLGAVCARAICPRRLPLFCYAQICLLRSPVLSPEAPRSRVLRAIQRSGISISLCCDTAVSLGIDAWLA